MLKLLDLFSGIGGFSLAAKWAGIEPVAFCEKDKFCQENLRRLWPTIPIMDDINKIEVNQSQRKVLNGVSTTSLFYNGDMLYDGTIDIISGGFPCQPFSLAGKRRGKDDDRDLWPAMFDVIKKLKPRWFIGENVANFVNMEFERTAFNLENEGYEVWALNIPAYAVAARHERKRAWIIAYLNKESGCKVNKKTLPIKNKRDIWMGHPRLFLSNDVADTRSKRIQGNESQTFLQERRLSWSQNFRSPSDFFGRPDIPKPLICRMDDGFSNRVDRLRALGNAIVPQIAFEIFKGIVDLHLKESE